MGAERSSPVPAPRVVWPITESGTLSAFGHAVVVVEDDVADVDADPKLDPGVLRNVGTLGSHAAQDFDRAACCIYRTGKLNQHTVDDATTVSGDT